MRNRKCYWIVKWVKSWVSLNITIIHFHNSKRSFLTKNTSFGHFHQVWINYRKFYTLPYRTQYSRNYEIHTPSKYIITEGETNQAIAHSVILGTAKCKVPKFHHNFHIFKKFSYNSETINNVEISYNKRYPPLSFSKYNETRPKLLHS